MIYRLPGSGKYSDVFVISSHGCWLVGCYASERAAKYALRFPDAELQRLWDEISDAEPDPDLHMITFEMLQKLRKSMKAKISNVETMVATAVLP